MIVCGLTLGVVMLGIVMDGGCQPKAPRVDVGGMFTPAPTVDIYDHAIAMIHWQESRFGADPRCKPGHVGPAGEIGEFQITPIWLDDIHRLGVGCDPWDRDSCRRAIRVWLKHYGPRVGAKDPDDLARLYNLGPTGFRRWQEARP